MKQHSHGASKSSPERRKKSHTSWKDYVPLMMLIGVTCLAASVMQWARTDMVDEGQVMEWMHDFMGLFLMIFALLKLFDLSGFADGFQMYDLLAKRMRTYALTYPFIELALGLGYLARWQPVLVYVVTVMVLLFGASGVMVALKRGLDVHCACMGNILKVPLSTVALVEDGGMALMAAAMFLAR